MTCKDNCLHYKACKDAIESFGYTVKERPQDGLNSDIRCKQFEDKDLYIKLPSIGENPDVWGKWIENMPYTYATGNITMSGFGESCSLCGWVNKGGIEKHFKYCPNCGARMDGEQK